MLEVIVDAPYDPNKPTIFINVVFTLFTSIDGRKYLYPENMIEARYDTFGRVRAMTDEGFQVVLYYKGKLAARNVFKGEMKDIVERELPDAGFITFSDNHDIKKYIQRHKASFLIGTGLRGGAVDEMSEEYRRDTYDFRVAKYLNVTYYNPKEIFDPFPITDIPPVHNPIFVILTWKPVPAYEYFEDVMVQLATLYPNLNLTESMLEALYSDVPCMLTMSVTSKSLLLLGDKNRVCVLYSMGDYMERSEDAHSNLQEVARASHKYINRAG